MSRTVCSKTQFRPEELEILQALISSYPSNSQIQYKKLTHEFNLTCGHKLASPSPKSTKAIQLKVKAICRIQKHYWSSKLDQLMLDQVGAGLKWRKIAEMPDFRAHGLSSNQIKRKFECGIRNKFLCLYRQIYKDSNPPHISDITFKGLFQRNKIAEYFQNGFIDQSERLCLESNIALFKTSIDEDQIRSAKTKNRVLNLVQPGCSLRLLVNTILKIHSEKKHKNQDIVQQLLAENEPLKRSYKEAQSTQVSPSYSSASASNSNFDPLIFMDEDGDKKIEEIDHQLDFEDFDDIFTIGAQQDRSYFSFDGLVERGDL